MGPVGILGWSALVALTLQFMYKYIFLMQSDKDKKEWLNTTQISIKKILIIKHLSKDLKVATLLMVVAMDIRSAF